MSNHYPLIRNFLNKRIQVKVEGFVIEGKLLRYQQNSKDKPHSPELLVLQNGEGFHVLRGNFEIISEVK